MRIGQLRSRLRRLESEYLRYPDTGPLPSDFWSVLCGAIPLSQALPDTAAIIMPLMIPPTETGPDPYDARINALTTPTHDPN
jgi:hypothetical protein